MKKEDGVKRFAGILAEPLDPLMIGPLADEEYIKQKINERVAVEFEKMLALLEHYSIKISDPNPWYLLALTLAKEIVPGLKERVKKGAPKKWGTIELAVLHAEIDSLIEAEGLTIEEAASKLAKQEPWKSFLSEKDGTAFGPDPAEALRRAYHMDCDKRWIKIAKDARSYQAHVGDVGDLNHLIINPSKMK